MSSAVPMAVLCSFNTVERAEKALPRVQVINLLSDELEQFEN